MVDGHAVELPFGGHARLIAVTSGVPQPAGIWLRNAQAASAWQPEGGTGGRVTLVVPAEAEGTYYCIVRSVVGSATSAHVSIRERRTLWYFVRTVPMVAWVSMSTAAAAGTLAVGTGCWISARRRAQYEARLVRSAVEQYRPQGPSPLL